MATQHGEKTCAGGSVEMGQYRTDPNQLIFFKVDFADVRVRSKGSSTKLVRGERQRPRIDVTRCQAGARTLGQKSKNSTVPAAKV